MCNEIDHERSGPTVCLCRGFEIIMPGPRAAEGVLSRLHRPVLLNIIFAAKGVLELNHAIS